MSSSFSLRHRLLALCLALATLTAAAAAPGPFSQALEQFLRAEAGERSAIEPAVARWQALSAAEPNDPVLRAYAGAATSMQALTTWLPWRKMSHVDDGMALIDKALAQLSPAHDQPLHRGVPASLETRFVAASTFLGLPPSFNRGARGQQLLDEVSGSPLLDAAPLLFRGAVWLRAGQAAAQAGRKDAARRWFERVAASGAPQAAAAQTQLQAL